jgi:2-desacetyl-2-hydroxyethyl bacteriochlorophyllide A dehydrogenase
MASRHSVDHDRPIATRAEPVETNTKTARGEQSMKAAYQFASRIQIGDVPDPTPGKSQVVVRTHRCGLCASDQHFLHSGAKMVALSREIGGPYSRIDLDQPFVPGHEYVGEIVDFGPDCRRTLRPGTRVTSLPLHIETGGAFEIVGISNSCPGGFGEYMLLDEALLCEIPAVLDDDRAAMVEPLAVGLEHARKGLPTKDDIPLVVGCGAIGLAVIAGLRLLGAAPVVAADFEPRRRDLAVRMGADIVIDPRERSPYGPLPGLGARRTNLVYECVGRPGMLDLITRAVDVGTRIVMGGFCLEAEPMSVACGQLKKLQIIFPRGEEQEDMDLALRAIADGRIDVAPWLGATIGLGEVAASLDAMTDPASPIRTIVDPRRP